MPRKFYKFKLLLDENMPPRQRFPRLNSRYDLKHITQDFHIAGLLDPQVYDFARKEKRLILTFNGEDFRPLVDKSIDTGIVYLSDKLLSEHIDAKLTALLSKSTQNSLFGRFTTLTGETVI